MCKKDVQNSESSQHNLVIFEIELNQPHLIL